MKPEKILEKILSGSKNIKFDDFTRLIEAYGFALSRVNGSHHVFTHPDVERPLPVQEVKGEAKPYQVRQLLKLVEKHNLRLKWGG
jgi:predicted RNA binding protein YcfA (HicA-like mRNA interferase family)